MRLVLVSDTHGLLPDLRPPDGDVLIHCGDATMTGEPSEWERFRDWMNRQPHEHKLFVPGNHDFRALGAAPMLEEVGVEVLIDRGLTIDGVRFWGHPWTPTFGRWAWMLNSDPMREKVSEIPECDVLISHGPPHLFLDKNIEGGHCGCEFLLQRVIEIGPKLHVFGHIHEAAGRDRLRGGTVLINASALGRDYRTVNPVQTFDLDEPSASQANPNQPQAGNRSPE